MTTNSDSVIVEDGKLFCEKNAFLIKTQFTHLSEPLIQFGMTGGDRTVLVQSVSGIQFGVGYSVSKSLQVGVDSAVAASKVAGSELMFGAGDARLYGKYQFFEHSKFSFATLLEGYIPIGSQELFLSNSSFGYGILFAGTFQAFSWLSVNGNVGFRNFSNATYQNVDQSNQVPLGLGFYIPLATRWSFHVESQLIWLPGKDANQNPGEFYLGGRYQLAQNLLFSAGAAAGSFEADGSSSVRVIAGVQIDPSKKHELPEPTVVKECEIKSYYREFYARELTSEERSKIGDLPYLSSRGSYKTFNIGEKENITQNKIPYVRNGQVVFAFDLTGLPARGAVLEIRRTFIEMEVNTVSNEPNLRDEIFCILNQQVCSGELIRGGERKHVNQKFFHGRSTPNDNYSRLKLQKKVAQVEVEPIYSGKVEIHLNRILENAHQIDTSSVLYGHTDPEEKPPKKTLYFLAGDDTYVHPKAKLVIELKEDTCYK